MVAALVGAGAHARTAAAESLRPEKPALSLSVAIGPVAVDADASAPSPSSASVNTNVATPATAVDAPATAVDATVDPGSAQNDEQVVPESPPEGIGVRVHMLESLPPVSAGVDIGVSRGIDAAVRVKSQAASVDVGLAAGSQSVRATVDLSTPIGKAKAAISSKAIASASNEGSAGRAPSTHRTGVALPASRPAVVRPAHRIARGVVSARRGAPSVTKRGASHRAIGLSLAHKPADPTPLPVSAPATGSNPFARPDGAFGGGLAVASTQASQTNPERGPAPSPASGGLGGLATGSGSSATFFAILTAFLMLAAQVVGRWFRPATSLAPQPAFASLPERPG